MNTAQRLVLLAGVGLAVWIGLYPPWIMTLPNGIALTVWHQWLLYQPTVGHFQREAGFRIDAATLCVYFGAIALSTYAGVTLARSRQ